MDIIMPKMGESVSEGTIIKWHKKKGDNVKRDEIIFEISTDKVDTEIPSPADGVLAEVKFNEGDTVDVGTVVAVIDPTGEAKDNGVPEKVEAQKTEKPAYVETTKTAEEKAEVKIIEDKNAQPVPEPEVKPLPASEGILEITMPKMGESVMEGTIIKWYKKVGDAVKKDEIMFEISTDKVDTEVPSPAAGVVAEILVAEQETVEVGTVVAKLTTSGAQSSSLQKETPALPKTLPATEKPVEYIKEPAAMNDKFSNAAASDLEETKEKEISSKFISPLVLNIAKTENVSFSEMNNIIGTGLDGRITKKDILAYVEVRKYKPQNGNGQTSKGVQPAEVASTVSSNIQYQPGYSSSDVEKIPMDNMRQKIMQYMINSRDTSVHVSAMLEVDMTKIYNYIKANRDEYLKKEDVKLTYMPFIAQAVVKALREFPLVNSSIEGATIVKKKFINLGIAVAVEPTGLIVPNIKNADEKSITGLAKSINDIAVRARNKKLTLDDITNGTFTITNYGVFGTIFGTPIINQPEVAILGVGTVIKRPVVIEVDGTDTIAIKPIMALTLSHDHRLIDGMLGGKFLKFMKDTLESFSA